MKIAKPENPKMKEFFAILLTSLMIFSTSIPGFSAASRIKDIVKLEGVSNNKLIGYGIVVGLAGTGDRNRGIIDRTMANILKIVGSLQVDVTAIRTQNAAAVMVTADLPPFSKSGDTVDVVVSSIGDAASIEGGTLLLAPLKAPDGKIYAMAQGTLSIGGVNPQRQGGRQQNMPRNHPAAGRIPRGALVHQSLDPEMEGLTNLTLVLYRPDFTTATRIMNAVNTKFGNLAQATDAATVRVAIPAEFAGKSVEFFANIGSLTVVPDEVAKVVVNERTGTVIMGNEVKLSPVAIAHGNLSVIVKPESETPKNQKDSKKTKQPAKNAAQLSEELQQKQVIFFKENPTLKSIVDALNIVGATPRDLIAILQALRQSGALQAELEVI